MKFTNIKVYNFEQALFGMRNPLNSWDKSDSKFGICHSEELIENIVPKYMELFHSALNPESGEYDYYQHKLFHNMILRSDGDYVDYAAIGPKDLDLAQRLILAGTEHRKFLRQIFVTVDITAPLYW